MRRQRAEGRGQRADACRITSMRRKPPFLPSAFCPLPSSLPRPAGARCNRAGLGIGGVEQEPPEGVAGVDPLLLGLQLLLLQAVLLLDAALDRVGCWHVIPPLNRSRSVHAHTIPTGSRRHYAANCTRPAPPMPNRPPRRTPTCATWPPLPRFK